jgi:ribosomal protein L11 methyltransferase
LDIRPGTVTIKKIKRQDWAEAWKHHFKPIAFGRSLLIKPSWSRRRPRKGQAVVVLDPGLSFGTGQHPTTEFCLAQLVAARHIDTAQSFLDVGTGSGILALAAAKLGYHPVQGFDADPEAVRVARENARKNRVLHRIRLVHADLTRLPISSKFKYHIVCANLTSDLLIAQRPRILNRMRSDGILVVSGVLRIEFEHLRKCYCESGLRLRSALASKEWHSGVFAFDHELSAFRSRSKKSAKKS